MSEELDDQSDILGLLMFARALDEIEPPDWPEAELLTAVKHVARGRAIIAAQHVRLEDLRKHGHPTNRAKSLLKTFLETQRLFEQHELHLREEMETADATSGLR